MVRSSSIDEETSLITEEVCEGLSLLKILLLPLFLTVVHSPIFDSAYQAKLWKLLSVIYSTPELKQCCGAVQLFHLVIESNLADPL